MDSSSRLLIFRGHVREYSSHFVDLQLNLWSHKRKNNGDCILIGGKYLPENVSCGIISYQVFFWAI